jgi:hypothetical protein
MGDTISRQAAIDALAKHEKSNGHNYTLFMDIVSECAEIIRDLPSAQMAFACAGCRYERKGSVVCDDCSRFFMDRYERRAEE